MTTETLLASFGLFQNTLTPPLKTGRSLRRQIFLVFNCVPAVCFCLAQCAQVKSIQRNHEHLRHDLVNSASHLQHATLLSGPKTTISQEAVCMCVCHWDQAEHFLQQHWRKGSFSSAEASLSPKLMNKRMRPHDPECTTGGETWRQYHTVAELAYSMFESWLKWSKSRSVRPKTLLQC